MGGKANAYHLDRSKRHGNTKWTLEAFEPIMVDIRARMKRKDVCVKHNITKSVLDRKIEEYHAGELK